MSRRDTGPAHEITKDEGIPMQVLDHNTQPLEKWRDGVMTLMRASATVQSKQLCIFDQFCDPGLGAPMHIHAVEEVLEVYEGTAEIYLRNESMIVTANQSVLIPAGARHGFKNVGTGILRVRATLAAAIFEASYDNSSELSRRYVPQDA
ncbi:mannose-6-phosphate isomerase-like protein (cupin superfamily) [Bosea sp. BE125]|uniref:cupin domain-containing protein n=1 Tax=Bosea sp. BE125 TaxID=2817909 RepID=UPI0028552F3C|nr:cupin domain-containing protein [Bosea sp. BE125]MDR6874106.1 mannose-6-phosphate isomerase-like protein (cupin superfamily) [Bosea sp. BE125]